MNSQPVSSKSDIVVLVPARNEAPRIAGNLEAVYASQLAAHQDLHVTVCANACTDKTLEVLDRVKRGKKNLAIIAEYVPGKPRALNALIDHTEKNYRLEKNDAVVFLDAHAEVQPNTLSELTTMLRHDKSLKAVSANRLSAAPASDSVLDHFLFGMSELSLSAIALQDRKTSCMAVRADEVKGMRFPEDVILDDYWMTMYLGGEDHVEMHPTAFTLNEAPTNFVHFAGQRLRHLMGLYQLERYFDSDRVKEEVSTGMHEHVHAFAAEKELRDQFRELPFIYQMAGVAAVPVHATLKGLAWIGYHLLSVPTPRVSQARAVTPLQTNSRRPRAAATA